MTTQFRTVINLNPNRNIEHFKQSLQRWLVSSPHYDFNNEHFEALITYGELGLNDNVLMYKESRTPEHDIIGMNLRTPTADGNSEFQTSVVGCYTDQSFKVGINIDYQTLQLGQKTIKANNPFISGLLLSRIGGGYDGTLLETQGTPHFLEEKSLPFVGDILNAKSQNALPVVYLSADDSDWKLAPPLFLAKRLAGIAHVLVEPNREFSFKLKTLTEGRNAYGGMIGIYWPGNTSCQLINPHKIPNDPKTNKPNLVTVLNNIIVGNLKHQILPEKLTWEGIINMETKEKMKVLRSQIGERTEVDPETQELFNLMDKQLETRTAEISERDNRIRFLEEQLARENAKCGASIDFTGSGKEIYLLKQHLVQLEREKPSTAIRAIIESLPELTPYSTQVEKCKNVFRSGSIKQIRKNLRKLGLKIEETGGNHFKVFNPEFPNKAVTISNTPSDHRSRDNEWQRIKRAILSI